MDVVLVSCFERLLLLGEAQRLRGASLCHAQHILHLKKASGTNHSTAQNRATEITLINPIRVIPQLRTERRDNTAWSRPQGSAKMGTALT